MQVYRNLGKNSAIKYYDIGEDWIIVRFKGNINYEYNYFSSGVSNIESMKLLAVQGEGLNSYINKNVKNKYLRKF